MPYPKPPIPAEPEPTGQDIIARTLNHLPGQPGVYRMYDSEGEVLYVGKARHLRNRVANYARREGHTRRIARMIALTRSLEFVTTQSESDALLLEANMIKRLRPRFNVLMRDDKSFPYILLRQDHEAPQIVKHRGKQSKDGTYFGPYASTRAVNHALLCLQKAFLLRTCTDSSYAGRSRACLLYQIKRCAGPCVGHIGLEDYAKLAQQAQAFLSGKACTLQTDLSARMEAASDRLEFETAANLRDRIRALSGIRQSQGLNPSGMVDADIFAIASGGGQSCVQVFFVRSQQCRGTASYYPAHHAAADSSDVLLAFLSQFYDKRPCPRLILTNHPPSEAALLVEALSSKSRRKLRLLTPKQGKKHDFLRQVEANAQRELARKLADTENWRKISNGLMDVFGLSTPPKRIDVFDNSHIRGTNAVGAMIVAGPEGFEKRHYRQFNIRRSDITPGDDYGMMREVLHRRYAKAEAHTLPDLVLIDGGAGQLSVARDIWTELGMALDNPCLVAISKGPERNAGREFLHMPDRAAFQLPPNNLLLHYLQRLRDEAHRFAIGAHRKKRLRGISRSPLDEISGLGPARKKALLYRFGSVRGIASASPSDLETTDGISAALAARIHDYFHEV